MSDERRFCGICNERVEFVDGAYQHVSDKAPVTKLREEPSKLPVLPWGNQKGRFDEKDPQPQEGGTTGISKIFGTWPGDETDEQLLGALDEIRKPSLSPEMAELRALVNEQAEDEGLWFQAEYISETYLQQALRLVHDRAEKLLHALEGKSHE